MTTLGAAVENAKNLLTKLHRTTLITSTNVNFADPTGVLLVMT